MGGGGVSHEYFSAFDLGKTHKMEGDLSDPELYGIIPRSAEAIFRRLEEEECSYLEIYNEELCDLLVADTARPKASSPSKSSSPASTRSGDSGQSLVIMEGQNGPFCRGLSQQEVKNAF